MKKLISLEHVGLKFVKRISLQQAQKSREFWALEDVTFSLFKGEVLGVIGRNGAGKSTILSLLAGIIAPNRGCIKRNTESVSLLSLAAGFIPHLSGRKNIILNGMLLGLSKKEISSKIPQIIDFSELKDFINEPVQTYSSGMQTRLGFSIALYINPEVILIDEVLGVGDAEFQAKSSEVMRQKITGDTTAVIVSHNEQTIKDLCDRAVWIEKGVSIIEGDVDLVLYAYNNNIQDKSKLVDLVKERSLKAPAKPISNTI